MSGDFVMVNEVGSLIPLRTTAIMAQVVERLRAQDWGAALAMEGQVREIPDAARAGFKHFKYLAWFGVPQCDAHIPLREVKELPLQSIVAAHHVRAVAQFRCGMHW
jgi:hypothetical protein